MRTREEIKAEYDISNAGLIINAGKFEGQPWWVVALWEASLDGLADVETDDSEHAKVCATERDDTLDCDCGANEYPILTAWFDGSAIADASNEFDDLPENWIGVFETENGFINYIESEESPS